MRNDPDHAQYLERWAGLYEESNYHRGLAAYFLRKSHAWCESSLGERRFDDVIEVGAGTGIHIDFVKHPFVRYWMTDLNAPMLERVAASRTSRREGEILVRKEDATRLTFPAAHFDRLIAAHVLEHLPRPHEVLKEWARVVKPGGIISLVLACNPDCLGGLAVV